MQEDSKFDNLDHYESHSFLPEINIKSHQEEFRNQMISERN